jgi:predicted Rdx family selenoprotein
VTATWLANEFFSVFGPDVAIALTPAANGRLEIYLDGEKIFDRKAEGGDYPELTRIWQLRQVIQEKLDALVGTPSS